MKPYKKCFECGYYYKVLQENQKHFLCPGCHQSYCVPLLEKYTLTQIESNYYELVEDYRLRMNPFALPRYDLVFIDGVFCKRYWGGGLTSP